MSDHKKMTVYLRPDQWLSMRAVALDNASETGGCPDVSKILREMVDVYLQARFPTYATKSRKKPVKTVT